MKRSVLPVVFFILVAFVFGGCSRIVPKKELPTTLPETDYLQVPLQYKEILSDYEKLVDYRLSKTFEEDYNSGKELELSEMLSRCIVADHLEDIGYRWNNMLAEMVSGLTDPTSKSFGYLLRDINGDGVQELFWVRCDGFILAVFTIYGQKVQIVDAHWQRYKTVVTEEGELYTRSSSGAADTIFEIKKLGANNGELTLVKRFGTEGVESSTGTVYYEVTEEKKIIVDEARFAQLLSIYSFEAGKDWEELSIIYLQ